MVELIDIVCCPNCQGGLEGGQGSGVRYICKDCKSAFREKEGILILISKELEEELRN